MAEWIIPCNQKYYDVDGAFNEYDKINWKQSTPIKKNDLIYIYISSPVQQIKYICLATKVDLSTRNIDDSPYVKDGTNYENYGRYMELLCLHKLNTPLLGRKYLAQEGLRAVQGPSRLPDTVSSYIDKILKVQPGFIKGWEVNSNELLDNSIIIIEDKEQLGMIPKIRNIIASWCQTYSEQHRDFFYNEEWDSGDTYIRFTTQTLECVLPTKNNKTGSWMNGHRAFYEIDNREGKIFLRCVLGPENIQENERVLCEQLLALNHKQVKKEDWKYAYLQTWLIEEYNQSETYDSVAEKLLNKMDEMMGVLEQFENDLFIEKLKVNAPSNDYTSIEIKEGGKVSYYTTKYERSKKNREIAIIKQGLSCKVCGFNFESKYGAIGQNFIEVHHTKPLASLKEEIVIDPETDLVCLCSNCHRMIHKKCNGVYTVEELKNMLK